MELETIIRDITEKIEPLDDKAMADAWKYWDSLCKPLRGMGMLEEMVVHLAGVYGNYRPKLEKSAVVVMGADNGVVAEGVTQTGSEVTAQVLENMGEILCLHNGRPSWRRGGAGKHRYAGGREASPHYQPAGKIRNR